MSEKNTERLIEDDGSLGGDALLHAIRRDMQSLFGLVKALDEKVDARLHDTVPIWEGVLSRLDAIAGEQESQGKRLAAIEGRLDAIEGRLDAVEVKLDRLEMIEPELRHLRRRIEGMIGELSRDVVEVRAAQHDLEGRLEKLEKPPA